MQLPKAAQQIADVIGVEKALLLIGGLPKRIKPDIRYAGAKRTAICLYVPRSMSQDHVINRILGPRFAKVMSDAFGGETLHLTDCDSVYRPFRDVAIRRLYRDGISVRIIADWFEITERMVKIIIREIPTGEQIIVKKENAKASSKNKKLSHAS